MSPSKPGQQFWLDIGWASSVGLVMVFCTVIGLAMGIGLDRLCNTRPWFTLIFLILGIVSGFWNILKDVLGKDKHKENDKYQSTNDKIMISTK